LARGRVPPPRAAPTLHETSLAKAAASTVGYSAERLRRRIFAFDAVRFGGVRLTRVRQLVRPHGRLSPALRGLARLPVVRAIRRRPSVDRFVAAHFYAQSVEEVWPFVIRELFLRKSIARYRPRGSRHRVTIRHRTSDLHILAEFFMHRLYDMPPEAHRALASLPRPPKVLDLGAHIGLFGVHILDTFRDATVVAFEPDPLNAKVLRSCIELNAKQPVWTVVEACASTADGAVDFVAGQYAESQIAYESNPATVTIPARDVFPFFEVADLVKIDVEGAEWPLLSDPRFGRGRARVIALEHHPQGCPEADPEKAAYTALSAAGFTIRSQPIPHARPGVGLMWAWRSVGAQVESVRRRAQSS